MTAKSVVWDFQDVVRWRLASEVRIVRDFVVRVVMNVVMEVRRERNSGNGTF